MPRLPEFPLTITIPNHHQRLLCELREDTYNILSLDPVTRELVKLPWYVGDGYFIIGRVKLNVFHVFT
jgi:hypothetical protein